MTIQPYNCKTIQPLPPYSAEGNMKKHGKKEKAAWRLVIAGASVCACLFAGAVLLSGSLRREAPQAKAWHKDAWRGATCDLRGHLKGLEGNVSYFEKVDAQGRKLLEHCISRIPSITLETLHDPEFDEIRDESIGPSRSCARNMVKPLREAERYLELSHAAYASLVGMVNAGYPMDGEEAAEKLRFEQRLSELGARARQASESLAALDLGIKKADKMTDDRIEELGGMPDEDG